MLEPILVIGTSSSEDNCSENKTRQRTKQNFANPGVPFGSDDSEIYLAITVGFFKVSLFCPVPIHEV